MEGLKVQVSNNTVQVTPYLDLITSGTIGLTTEFTFSDEWQGLTRLAVFKAGSVVKTVEIVDDAVVVPWEVLDKPNVLLRIGVYGIKPDCTLAIPTVWADVCKIYPGADPNDDPTTDPTLPIWQDLIIRVEELEQYGGGGAPGKDGFSPTANVTQTAEGAVITITDKDGTTEATVANGKDGFSPSVVVVDTDFGVDIHITDHEMTHTASLGNGKDGFSPSITVTESTDKGIRHHRIDITDKDGTQYFYVYDGASGNSGMSAYEIATQNGFDGTEEEWLESLKGKPGYTPQKGIDYWTPSDIAEIKSYVDEAILGGSW